jgi:ribonuclease P protein component
MMIAAFAPPPRFQNRADFLRLAATGRKIARPGFVLQFLRHEAPAPLRVGYTATKKIGNAVSRNRARRRLKEAARLVLPALPLAGVELVLICRKETATTPFAALQTSLRATLTDALK